MLYNIYLLFHQNLPLGEFGKTYLTLLLYNKLVQNDGRNAKKKPAITPLIAKIVVAFVSEKRINLFIFSTSLHKFSVSSVIIVPLSPIFWKNFSTL